MKAICFKLIKKQSISLSLIICFLFLNSTCFSQIEWAPNGAVWHYEFSNWTTEGYYKIESIGDTTIDFIQCNKLRKTIYKYNYLSLLLDTIIIGTEYTYADSNKVYLYKYNQFYTLYDFSAKVGSSWIVPGIKRYSDCDTIGIIRVDSIGTININNYNLKYICVSLIDTTQKWGWNAKIVERIGPVKSFCTYPYDYLFPQKFDYCGMILDESIEGGTFRCYQDDSFQNYSINSSVNCDYITSINEDNTYSNTNNINIHSSYNKLVITYFDTNLTENLSIEIHNLNGKLVYKSFSNNQEVIEININKFTSGIYIINVKKGFKIIETKKWLKSR